MAFVIFAQGADTFDKDGSLPTIASCRSGDPRHSPGDASSSGLLANTSKVSGTDKLARIFDCGSTPAAKPSRYCSPGVPPTLRASTAIGIALSASEEASETARDLMAAVGPGTHPAAGCVTS